MAEYTTHSFSVKLTDPTKEFTDLCQTLFNKSNLQECLALDQTARTQLPVAKNQGLFSYAQGLMSKNPTFTYQEAERLFGQKLRSLQGARAYLVGTGTCVAESDTTCFKADAPNPPLVFDFVDDIYNLVGAFELLRESLSGNRTLSSCDLSVATYGTKDTPYCHMYYSHNLLSAPTTLAYRNAKAYIDRTSPSERPVMSTCR